jgi:predicted phage terminase large subunit-like protein
MMLQKLIEWARQLLTDEELAAIQHCDLTGPNGLRRYLASQSIHAFIDLYFADEFYLPLAPFQLDILSDCQDIRDRATQQRPGVKLARALPRAHAKSTFYARILPLHGFLFDWSPLTVLLGNNDDAARRLVSNIKTAIESNETLQEDFPNSRGAYWGNEKLENSAGSVITSFGIGSGSIRGVSTGKYRPSLIIGDDLDDDKSVRSMVELANNKEWIDKSVLALGDNISYKTSFVIIGTIIRKTSLLRYILDNPQFYSLTASAVQRFATSQELWEQWRTTTLALAHNNEQPKDASEDIFYQEHKEELLANTQMLWDRPDAYRQAMLYKLANERAFYSEYQNQPQETGGAFGVATFVTLPTDEREYDLLAALDPTEKGGKSNDLAAYVEVLFHRKQKQVIVSYIDAKQRSYSETIDTLARRVRLRGKHYNGFWVETNAAGGIIRDLLSERFQQDAIPINIHGVHNTVPKTDRISALSEYMQRGQLFFADTLPPEFHHELEAYPFVQHDDILDAISTIVLSLKERGLLDILYVEY